MIRLSLGDGPFQNGLARAYDSVVKFQSKLLGIGGSFVGSIMGGGHVLDSGIRAGMQGVTVLTDGLKGVLNMIPVVGPLLGAIAGAFGDTIKGALDGVLAMFSLIREQAGKAKEMMLNADKLGISVEAISRLGGLPGVEMEKVVHALTHLQAHLGQAATGSNEAAAGFIRLGYSIEQVKAMSKATLDQAIGPLFDRIRSLPTAAERAASASMLFGQRIQSELMPAILQGSAGLEAAANKMDAFGLTLTRLDATKLIAARVALDALDKVFAGIKMQIAIELAPIVIGLAQELEKLIPVGANVGDVLKIAFETLKPILTTALNSVQTFATGLVTTLAQLMAGFNNFIIAMRDGFQKLSDLSPGNTGAPFHEAALGIDQLGIASNNAFQAIESLRVKMAGAGPWSGWVSDLIARANEWAQRKAMLPPGVGAGPGLLPASGHEHQFAAAMEKGSKEAMSAANKYLSGQMDAAGKAAAVAEGQRAKTNEYLARIAGAIGGGPAMNIGLAVIGP